MRIRRNSATQGAVDAQQIDVASGDEQAGEADTGDTEPLLHAPHLAPSRDPAHGRASDRR